MTIFQIQAKDAVYRIGKYDAVNCLQSFNWDVAMNEEKLTQLGDANYDAQTITPEVNATMEARATGSLSSILSRMIQQYDDVTGEYEGDLGTANTGLIRETDLEFAVFDLIESKKANEVFDRSTLIPRAHLATFTLSASVDGAATESYTLDADLLEIFRAPMHDLVAIPVVRNAGGDADTEVILPVDYTVELGVVVADADWKVYALDIDGNRVMAADLVLTSDVGGDVLALSAGKIAAGVTIPVGARTAVYAYRKVPGTMPVIMYPTTARFVKADHINIYLVDPAATFDVGGQIRTVEAHLDEGVDFNTIPLLESDVLLRVQNVELSVDLRREALREIKKRETGNPIFYRAATYPLDANASFSVFETDLSEFAKLQGAGPTDVLDLASFEGKEWMLITRYYKGDAPLQTVGLLNGRVTNPGTQLSVNGRSEVSYQLTGSKIAIQGAAV